MLTVEPRFRPSDPFRCHVRRDGDSARVRLSGELDIACAGEAEDELTALRRAGCSRIVVDLSGLTFMELTGLRVLLRWDAKSRRDGFSFAIVPGPAPIRRLLELTHTAGRFCLAEPQ